MQWEFTLGRKMFFVFCCSKPLENVFQVLCVHFSAPVFHRLRKNLDDVIRSLIISINLPFALTRKSYQMIAKSASRLHNFPWEEKYLKKHRRACEKLFFSWESEKSMFGKRKQEMCRRWKKFPKDEKSSNSTTTNRKSRRVNWSMEKIFIRKPHCNRLAKMESSCILFWSMFTVFLLYFPLIDRLHVRLREKQSSRFSPSGGGFECVRFNFPSTRSHIGKPDQRRKTKNSFLPEMKIAFLVFVWKTPTLKRWKLL
jgi:hypothetical protein